MNTAEEMSALDRRRQEQIKNQREVIDRLLDGAEGVDEIARLAEAWAAAKVEIEQLRAEIDQLKGNEV